jgi:hypothetical protein
MKIQKPNTCAIVSRTLRFGGKDLLCVGMLAMFPLDRPQPDALVPEAELWKVAMQSIGDDAVLDLGYPKASAEWFVYGAAYTPDATPSELIAARAQIGPAQKELYIVGDRYFDTLGGISTPEPFTRMPLVPARAFGGPSFAENPVGKGTPDSKLAYQNGVVQPLPNIERPGSLMLGANDRPAPAGFWAIAPHLPSRSARLGAFDARWLARDWPHLPGDTDVRFFSAAPEDQRIDDFWRGEEPISLQNLHPARAIVKSRLPGLRARCMIRRRAGDRTQIEETEARAETVWLFPEGDRGIILYRAVFAVDDEDADDVETVIGAWERLADAPLPMQHYVEQAVRDDRPESARAADSGRSSRWATKQRRPQAFPTIQ